jgi:GT2 family glycosyltransferase
MDLSVIIITHNSSPFIEACLRSITEQMQGLDYELIIVDNASTDETCGMIQRGFPDALLIQSPSNAGFARANNLGLLKARGEFVLLMNPDTLWKRGEVRKAMQFLRDHPETGGLGCRLILEDGSWQKSHGHFPTLSREMKEAFYLPRLFSQSPWSKGMFIYQEKEGPGEVDWVSATFFLSPREVILDIGGFDERYFMYYEDIDLSARLREKGREIYYYPEIEIIHYQRMPSVYDFGESPYLYFDKHFGTPFAQKLRYILLFKTLLRVAVFASLAFLTGKEIFREKLKTNYWTFKYNLFEAPRVIKKLHGKAQACHS